MTLRLRLSAARTNFKTEIEMLKLLKVFSAPLIKKNLVPSGSKILTRSVYDINFDSEEEIIKNVLGEVMIIGINLPNTKNLLSVSALEKLCDCIENFESNEKLSAAILYGCGGNFCTGVVPNKEALILSESLLNKLNELKKPVIGSLNGYATNFGVYLAIMCDMRIIDSAGLVGFSNKSEDVECPSFVYERLLFTVGLSRTLELICTRKMWFAEECSEAHFVTNVVELGSALGQSILMAQRIAFHRPLKSIIRDRSKILSFLSKKI